MKPTRDDNMIIVGILAFAHLCYHAEPELSIDEAREKIESFVKEYVETLKDEEIAAMITELRAYRCFFQLDTQNNLSVTPT